MTRPARPARRTTGCTTVFQNGCAPRGVEEHLEVADDNRCLMSCGGVNPMCVARRTTRRAGCSRCGSGLSVEDAAMRKCRWSRCSWVRNDPVRAASRGGLRCAVARSGKSTAPARTRGSGSGATSNDRVAGLDVPGLVTDGTSVDVPGGSGGHRAPSTEGEVGGRAGEDAAPTVGGSSTGGSDQGGAVTPVGRTRRPRWMPPRPRRSARRPVVPVSCWCSCARSFGNGPGAAQLPPPGLPDQQSP